MHAKMPWRLQFFNISLVIYEIMAFIISLLKEKAKNHDYTLKQLTQYKSLTKITNYNKLDQDQKSSFQ